MSQTLPLDGIPPVSKNSYFKQLYYLDDFSVNQFCLIIFIYLFIKTSLNTYSWGHINDTFGLDNDQFAIDELVLQSKKLEDDDSGNSTGKLSGLPL